MAIQAFYQTVAQLCFTLLGLWWLVLQTKYSEWIGNREQRRMITNISLYFLLPGSMSLMALLSTEVHLLWQVAFLVASTLGAIETGAALRGTGRRGAGTLLNWVGMGLYLVIALVALVAFIPAVQRELGQQLGVVPLSIAGILLTLVIVLGVTLAWTYFVQPPTAPAARGPETH
ncbi:MAG TPA: hypothetical protein VGN32_22005 [Ktedonobacterales bacterium]|jgi:hypothetical protein|nr:hypothetical protein [Ktedonobacterales bacterium]